MKEGCGVQRREICVLTGMALVFRSVYSVMVDGEELMNGGVPAVIAGLLLALPAVILLIPLRKCTAGRAAEEAVSWALGDGGAKMLGAVLFLLFTYDSAVSLRILAGAVRYVAMPEGSRSGIMAATAAAAALAVGRGNQATAGMAVLWRRAALILALLLIAVQLPQMNGAYLTPVLGPGFGEIWKGSLPTAGIFVFSVAGWLMLDPEHDPNGTAMVKTVLKTGVISALAAAFFCMLTPVMIDGPVTRSFRLGRLLANDRAGVSLEMPYVVLLYGGLLTMLLFEMAAAGQALRLVFPGLGERMGAWTIGGVMLLTALSGAAEREVAGRIALWYYPAAALPTVLLGGAAMIRAKRGKMKK